MKRFLIINFPGHGHVNPTLKMVKQLIKQGNKVVYYCTEEFKEKIQRIDADFRSYKYEAIKEEKRGDINIILKNVMNLIDGILEEVLKETDEYDVLIYDSVLPVGEDIADKLGIKKTVALYTTFAMSNKMIEEGKKTGRIPKMIKPDSNEFKTMVKNINEKYNIELKDLMESMVNSKADKKIVFTSKLYQPFSDSFDDSYLFIGPSIIKREENIDFEIDSDKDKTLIYVSLGTIDNKNISFYKNTFKALGSLKDINVILSIGKALNIDDLGEIPKNFKVYNYVPQLEVLEKADIFITHGGMNSSSEGLYNDVPLIVVPQFGDQPLVGRVVAGFGAGITIFEEELSDVTIKEAVEKIISDKSYKEKASFIGKSLRDAAKTAKDVYENL